MKNYNIRFNIAKVKYVLSFHNGIKKEKDGSPLYESYLTNNKRLLLKKEKDLISEGYVLS